MPGFDAVPVSVDPCPQPDAERAAAVRRRIFEQAKWTLNKSNAF
jgi:hypothetical protein